MSTNVREFQLNVRRIGKDGPAATMLRLRNAVALEALRGVVMLSPVRSGRLRGNWQTTAGRPAEGYDEQRKDPHGQATIIAGQTVLAQSRDPWTPIWLHNGVPYAVYVNDGTAKMAGAHMVERTVARLRTMRPRRGG